MSGTELSSTVTRPPSASISTTSASVTLTVPVTFCAKSSRARRVSSGAQTEVNWRPLQLPTTFSAAGFSQRITPVLSMT